jgi:hypothetical protein
MAWRRYSLAALAMADDREEELGDGGGWAGR